MPPGQLPCMRLHAPTRSPLLVALLQAPALKTSDGQTITSTAEIARFRERLGKGRLQLLLLPACSHRPVLHAHQERAPTPPSHWPPQWPLPASLMACTPRAARNSR